MKESNEIFQFIKENENVKNELKQNLIMHNVPGLIKANKKQLF